MIEASPEEILDVIATYTLIPEDADGKLPGLSSTSPSTLLVPLPAFVFKRVIKGCVDTATEVLRKRVLSVRKGC